MRGDKRLIVTAAAQAQKASDLILGRTFGEQQEEQEQTAHRRPHRPRRRAAATCGLTPPPPDNPDTRPAGDARHIPITTHPTKRSNAMQTTTTKTAKSTKAGKPAAAAKKPKKPAKPKQTAPAAPAGLALAIPLDKLAHDPANVRTDAGDVTELAASIAAHNLIQPLTVRPETKVGKDGESHPTGRYLVTAGGRRLRALLKLAGQKRLPKDAGVPCVIRNGSGEAQAREVSLAENVERLPMNAADEHAAFAALADAGMGSGDIAARFGVGTGGASNSGWRWGGSPPICWTSCARAG